MSFSRDTSARILAPRLRNVHADKLQQDFQAWWAAEGCEVLFGNTPPDQDQEDFWDFSGEFVEEETDPAALPTGVLDEMCPVAPLSSDDALVKVEDRSNIAEQINKLEDPELVDDHVVSELVAADPDPPDRSSAQYPTSFLSLVSCLKDHQTFTGDAGKAIACLARLEKLSEYMRKLSAHARLSEGILSRAMIEGTQQRKLSAYNHLQHEVHMARQMSLFGGAKTAVWLRGLMPKLL